MEIRNKDFVTEGSTVERSNDTLSIDKTTVATSKVYTAIGKLKEDTAYTFTYGQTTSHPMYCESAYAGCNSCVSSCASCNSICQNGCYNNCHGGCVTACQGGCVNGCRGACNAACYDHCNAGCDGGCYGKCNGGCYNDCHGGCVTTCASNNYGCKACHSSCNSGTYNGCSSVNGCRNQDGCTFCNKSVDGIECLTLVGCHASLFSRSAWATSTAQKACESCNSNFTCEGYRASCPSNCHSCHSTYGCTAGCRASYTCYKYIACNSNCQVCVTNEYACVLCNESVYTNTNAL